MSPDAQRRTIARQMGWTHMENCYGSLFGRQKGSNAWLVPDYPTDLNAMATVEATLTGQAKMLYGARLRAIALREHGWDVEIESFLLSWYTAPMRAEAYLRTMGKWTGPQVIVTPAFAKTRSRDGQYPI